MYERKVWVNRQSEHPSRRKLTPTGNDGEYDVSRSEASSWRMAIPSMRTR